MNILEQVVQSFKNKKAGEPYGLKPFVLTELSKNKLEEPLFMYQTSYYRTPQPSGPNQR